MKMLLHELHPAVIHTPLALLPTATVADVIAVTTGDRAWAKVGRRLWVAGTLSALFSGLAGLAASQEVKLEEPRARDMVFLHGLGNAVITLGAVGVTAGGAVATYSLVSGPQYAEVLAVQPIKETIKTPREVCKDVAVTRQAPVKDQHQIAGTAIGAVVGGLLGNQVGGGNGKKIATVAGAVGGGYAGNQVQGRMQANSTYTTTETRCSTVTDTHDKIVGYDVKYDLAGKVGRVRMDRDPGSQIPVQDGQLMVSQQ